MTTQLSPTPVFKAFDSNGAPLAFGLLYSYEAGTTTPQATYIDSTGGTPNTNPVVLNARGEANVWLNPSQGYKLKLTDASGNQIWIVDNILGPFNVVQSLIPAADNTYDLGSTSFAWRQLYLGANHSPALDTSSGIIGYYPRTAAEIAVSVVPTDYAYEPYTLLRYGADPTGVADSTTAINNCLTAAAQQGNVMVKPGILGGAFKITGPLNINTAECGFDGQGCELDCTGMTGSVYLWNPVNSSLSSAVKGHAAASSHPLQNFVAYGPGTAQPNVGFIIFNDTSSLHYCGGHVIRNGGSFDWNPHVTHQNGANDNYFENWNFDSSIPGSNFGTNTFVSIPSGSTNAGERNSFNNCRFGLCNVQFISSLLTNANTTFTNCSFDIVTSQTSAMIQSQSVNITFIGCHFEMTLRYNGATIGVAMLNLSGGTAKASLIGCQVIVDFNYTTADATLFYCDATVGNPTSGNTGQGGALSFRDTQFMLNSHPLPLVSGTGVVQMEGYTSTSGAISGPNFTALSRNKIADAAFNSGSLAIDGWVAAGGTPPVIDATNPYGGSAHDVKFGGTGTLTSRTIPCNPGQQAFCELQLAITGYSAGGLSANITYVRADGSSAGSGSFQFISLTATQAYAPATSNVSGGFMKAPPGTVGVVVAISSTLSGGGAGYLGRAVIDIV